MQIISNISGNTSQKRIKIYRTPFNTFDNTKFCSIVPKRVLPQSALLPESLGLLEKFKSQYNFGKNKPIQWGVKRASDYVGAVIGIIVTSPIMAAAAVAIKLESKGPVIFRQE